MSETKKMIRFFSVPQWKDEEAFLQEQHRRGWALTRVSGLGIYSFRQCQPEEVVYQLDYNCDGQKKQEDYLQIFRDCGWEYLQDFAGYSYFRKPAAAMQGHEEIFCDPQSRIDMIHRVFRGRMIPMLVIFLAMIPLAVIQLRQGRWILGGFYALLLALYIWIFISFGLAFRRLRKDAEK